MGMATGAPQRALERRFVLRATPTVGRMPSASSRRYRRSQSRFTEPRTPRAAPASRKRTRSRDCVELAVDQNERLLAWPETRSINSWPRILTSISWVLPPVSAACCTLMSANCLSNRLLFSICHVVTLRYAPSALLTGYPSPSILLHLPHIPIPSASLYAAPVRGNQKNEEGRETAARARLVLHFADVRYARPHFTWSRSFSNAAAARPMRCRRRRSSPASPAVTCLLCLSCVAASHLTGATLLVSQSRGRAS